MLHRNMDCLIVIPAFNEELNISEVLLEIKKHQSSWKFSSQILVINDGSSDMTSNKAREEHVFVLDLVSNIGIASVLHLACEIACIIDTKKLLLLDGDGQHPAKDIPLLYEACEANTIVIGTRDFSKYEQSIIRAGAIKLINNMVKMRHGIPARDVTSGFRVFSKEAYQFLAKTKGFSNFLEDTILNTIKLHNRKFGIVQVDVIMHNRAGGAPSTAGIKLVFKYISVLFRTIVGEK